ncbi:hypothetical protein BJ742DRAFT_69982 [Cladochytrium replicatum]|nr:hypothetical protein BJ742DRAFT_69982 [Cladochytrium replicatum]
MSSKDSKLSGTNPLPLSASSLPPSLATPTSPDHILPSSISPPLPRMNRRDTVPKRLSYGSSLSDLHSVHLNQHSSRLPVTTPSPEVDYYFPNNRIAASSQPVDPRSARSRWLPWLPWPSSPSSQTVLPMWNSPARSAACPPPAPPQLPSAVASPSRQSGKSSAPTPAPPGELELSLWVSDKTRSGSHPTLAYGINNGNAPPSMFDFMEAHILAALKRTSFSKFTLAFLDGETEEKYSAYFLDRSRYLWRTYAVISLLLCTLLQLLLTHFYPEIHFLGNPRSDFLLVLCGGTLPMLLLLMLHWKLPRSRLADCVPVLSLIFLLFLGPVQICGRQFINNPEKYPPSLTAPVYILVLLSSVFFFRIRFVYTVIGTLVSTVGWVAVFGAATREAVLKNPGDGLLTAFVCSSVGIILASVVTCFIAYDQERGFRLQYLSDQRFMRINTKLFKQLMGLQRSYISRIAADLDSPLEKAIMGLKYLMASPGVGAEHAPVLEMIMACLNSPNLMTPDLEHQVQRGQVDVDPEQEKWLFSEIARRKHSEPNASSAAAAAVAAVAARSVTPGPSTAAVNQATAPIGMMGSNASETTVATLVADLELGTSGDALEPGHNWISPLKWDDDRTTPTFMRDTPLPGLVALSPSPTSPYKTFDNTPAAIPEITKYCTSDALSMLQTSVNSWSFPIFAFHRSAREYPLMVMMHHLIVRSGLLTRLGIGSAEEVGKFMRFSKALEDGYHRDLMCKYHKECDFLCFFEILCIYMSPCSPQLDTRCGRAAQCALPPLDPGTVTDL